MKIKIDKEGNLLVERAGTMKNVYCPYVVSGHYCCDDCALFGEPVDGINSEWREDYGYVAPCDVVYITLCERTHECPKEDFVDERVKK